MSWSNFWVLVTGGAVTLFFGQVARMIEQGSRRGRLRREIREELELLEHLHEWPIFEARIRDRLHDKLAEYAPIHVNPDELDDDLASLRERAWAIVTVTPLSIVIALITHPNWWQLVGLIAAFGTCINILASAVTRRRRARTLARHEEPPQQAS